MKTFYITTGAVVIAVAIIISVLVSPVTRVAHQTNQFCNTQTYMLCLPSK